MDLPAKTFFIVLLTTVLFSLFNYYFITKITFENYYTHQFHHLQIKLQHIHMTVFEHFIQEDPEVMEKLQLEIQSDYKDMNETLTTLSGTNFQDFSQEFKFGLDNYMRINSEILKKSRLYLKGDALKMGESKGGDLFDRLLAMIKESIKDMAVKDSLSIKLRSIQLLVVSIAVSGILAVLIFYLINKALVSPLQKLVIASKKVASGEYNTKVEVVSNDEIGYLCENFNLMATSIKEKIGMIQQSNLLLEQKFDESQREISYRKIAELKLLEAKEVAEQAAKSKSVFISTMSHEIRTPMNAVIGMTSLLTRTKLTDEQREFVDTIRLSGEDLMRIINDILDLSKLETGKLILEEHPFNLRDCIEQSFDLFSFLASEKKIGLFYDFDSRVPEEIFGDGSYIRQILVNLIGNAIKFTENGEIIVKVHNNCVIDRVYEIQIEVSDTGIGIPEIMKETVFDLFTQVDTTASRKYGGSGLGLSISKRLVELMGGKIWVESTPDVGSTFSFTITAKPVPTQSREKSYEAKLRGKKLILLDGDKTSQAALYKRLNKLGIEVNAVDSVEQLYKQLKQFPGFDLVVLDQSSVKGDIFKTMDLLLEDYDIPNSSIVLIREFGGEKMSFCEKYKHNCINQPIKHKKLIQVLLTALQETIGKQEEIKDEISGDLDGTLAIKYPLKILLAEDNHINQLVAIKIMDKFGYSIDVAANGFEVIDSILRQKYDLVLMDIQMPEMDGLEATKQILQNIPDHRKPRIIAMTANVLPEDKLSYLELGMDDFLGKPVLPETIQAMLEKWGKILLGKNRAPKTRTGPTPEILDSQLFKVEMQDAKGVFLTMVEVFLGEAAMIIQEVNECLKANKRQDIQKAVIQLNQKSQLVGAKYMGELCVEIQKTIDNRENSQPDINELICLLDEAYRLTQKEFEIVFENLN
ncbi:MAG: ATP-binding protein [Deltaproteobacteria bacterium]|nr:ATP-binding protein [Deltaproteobacteria bacterium]